MKEKDSKLEGIEKANLLVNITLNIESKAMEKWYELQKQNCWANGSSTKEF